MTVMPPRASLTSSITGSAPRTGDAEASLLRGSSGSLARSHTTLRSFLVGCARVLRRPPRCPYPPNLRNSVNSVMLQARLYAILEEIERDSSFGLAGHLRPVSCLGECSASGPAIDDQRVLGPLCPALKDATGPHTASGGPWIADLGAIVFRCVLAGHFIEHGHWSGDLVPPRRIEMAQPSLPPKRPMATPSLLFADSTARRSRIAFHISERRLLLLAGDMAALGVALLISLWIRVPDIRSTHPAWSHLLSSEISWWLVLWALWIPAAIVCLCYDLKRAASGYGGAVVAAICAGVVALLYLVTPVISAPLTRSRSAWYLFAGLAVTGVGAWRCFYSRFLGQPSFARRLVIVGAGTAGRTLASALSDLADASAFELVGFVDDDPSLLGQPVSERTVLAASDQLCELAERHHLDDIVVAVTNPGTIQRPLLDALVRCWEKGIAIHPMPLYFEEATGAVPVEHLGQNLFALSYSQLVIPRRVWDWARRALDIAVALLGFPVFLIILPLVSLATHLCSPGPIFYHQQRVGRGGKLFRLTKFRSMVQNAESNGAVWSREDDPRVTPVGRFLRKTRLDELPQLWNVFVGDMSLIGPRPERPEFVEELEKQLPYYPIRHSVRPGLTGWAQVRYHYGSSVQDALAKLQYDLYYIKHRGPALDMLVLLHTIRIVLRMQGT